MNFQPERAVIKRSRVLVADDSGTMRKIIIRSLNAVGVIDVVEASDGNEACRLFDKNKFDLVLTDWNMPGKTGLEVLQEIRSTGATLPILMITTEGDKCRVIEAIQAGVSDYVVKPFAPVTLRAKLQQHLGQIVGRM